MSEDNTPKFVSYEVKNLVHDTFLFGGQLLVPNGRMRIPADRASECEVQLSVQLKAKRIAVRGLDAAQDAALRAEFEAKAAAKAKPDKD